MESHDVSLLEAPLPPGLIYFPDWLSSAEHDAALWEIDSHEFETGLSRRVQHYGARYDYDSARVAEIGSAPQIPPNLYLIGERLFKECNFERIPEQVIVNEYLSGQGIAAHIDKDSFGPKVATISLIENWTHEIKKRSTDKIGGLRIPRIRRLSLTFRTINKT